MTRTYIYETTVSWGGDIQTREADVKVSYGVIWGEEDSRDCPGSPSEIEDIQLLEVDGKPRPWGMYGGYIANEDDAFEEEVIQKLDLDRMLEIANEIECMDNERLSEMRYEDRRGI